MRRELLELLDLALEPGVLQRAVRDQHQPVGLERLLDEVVGAALDRRDRGLDVAVAGDHHHRQIGMLALHAVEQLQPVELASPAARCRGTRGSAGATPIARERCVAVARGARLVAFVLQNARDQLADIRFVVDDQDVEAAMTIHSPSSRACCFGWFDGCCWSTLSAAKRSRTHAPRPPEATSGASDSSMRAAVFLENLPDDRETEAGALLARRHIGLEQPVAVLLRQAGAVVDHVDHDLAALALDRDADAAASEFSGGTAAIASVAFLTMLVSACEISRRSNFAGIVLGFGLELDVDVRVADALQETTCRAVSATSSAVITGFGMRAKRENSSTMRLMSSTWRTIVSVHCSNTALSSVMTLPYLRFSRSAESWIGVSGFLISCAMRRAMSAQAEVRCAVHQVGDVVERHHIAAVLAGRLLGGDAHRQIALAHVAADRDLSLHQPMRAGPRLGEQRLELGHHLDQIGVRRRRPRSVRSASRPSG